MNRLGALAVLAGVATVLAAGCGVGGNGDLQRIGSGDLAGLDQTTTSTTTSTTTPITTTTVPPTASVTPGSTTPAPTTSTIPTELVELYFVAGDVLEPVAQQLTQGAGPSRVIEVLESGPPSGDAGTGLTTVLPEGLIRLVLDPGTGVATVDLVSELFESIEDVDQRRAIAQIVLTLTRLRGIGQVRFTLDGEDLPVPKLGNVLSEPGEPVARIDYESLLEQGDVITTEVPATTSTPLPESTTSPTT